MSLARASSRLPGSAGAVLRLALGRRWVTFDPVGVLPHLSLPVSKGLDSVVFLLPSDGGEIALKPMESEETQVRAAEHATYFHFDMLLLRIMFASAFPHRAPWPVFAPEASLRRLRDLMAGVAGWAVHYPRGASAPELAEAGRSTLVHPPASP